MKGEVMKVVAVHRNADDTKGAALCESILRTQYNHDIERFCGALMREKKILWNRLRKAFGPRLDRFHWVFTHRSFGSIKTGENPYDAAHVRERLGAIAPDVVLLFGGPAKDAYLHCGYCGRPTVLVGPPLAGRPAETLRDLGTTADALRLVEQRFADGDPTISPRLGR